MSLVRSDRRGLVALCVALTMALLVAGSFAGAAEKQTKEPSDPVDINTATLDELTTLPGIGPALAKRIVDFRDANGKFKRVEDLMKVKGIGEKSFQKLRPYVKVSRS